MNNHLNPNGGITVWLVEDNKHFRNTMVGLINRTDGFECKFEVESCEEAIEELRKSDPPDVILLDIGLKGMSGVEGVRKFKELTDSTDIIMLTVHDDSATVFDALCAGATGYLLKDSSPETIIWSMKEVAEGGAPMNPQIARTVVDTFRDLNSPRAEYRLTRREKEVLDHLVSGLNKKEIADEMVLSFHTVNTHIKNIYKKLQVNNRSGAVSKTLREKLV